MNKTFDYMPTTEDVKSSRILDRLLNKLHEYEQTVPGSKDIWQEILAKTEQASDLCSAYPHLNKNVVKLSMLLLPLVKKESFFAILQGVDEVLHDLGPEEKLLIFKVIAESQTEFARGEAKVVQYFMYS
ncbi:hypothetical protein JCM39194_08250 [Desulfotomaculum varum]